MLTRLSRFVVRLRRRKVFRAAAVYVIGAWALLQAFSILLPAFGFPDRSLGTLVLAAVVIFPLVLVFAWRYDLTMNGLVRSSRQSDQEQPAKDYALRATDYLLLVLLVGISVTVLFSAFREATGVSVEYERPPPSTELPENSIAILPFVNLGDDPADDYLGAGLAEDLIGGLARQTNLQVAARTSSFALHGSNLPIADISRQLHVRAILEGSFRKDGEQIRVSTQLIDARDGFQLWSDAFDQRLDQMQSIRRAILNGVARTLGAKLGTEDQSGLVGATPMTQVGEAYQNYLQGRYHWNQRGEENIRRGVRLFERAVELDPGFARAQSSLAAAYITLAEYSNDPIIETYEMALAAAREALRLDSNIGEAHAVIAVINHWNWDWVSAEAEFRQAIEVEPTDYTSLLWYSELLVELGRIDDGENLLLKALRVDPVSPPVHYLLSWLYLTKGDNELALKHANLNVEYGQPFGYLVESLVHLRVGQAEQAIAARAKFSSSFGLDVKLGTKVIEAVLDPAKVPDVLDRLDTAQAQGGFSSTSVLFDYFALQTDYILLGQTDILFDLLEDLIDRHFVRVRVLWLPEARAMRQDPRLKVLAQKIGMARFWQANGPPDSCGLTNGVLHCE